MATKTETTRTVKTVKTETGRAASAGLKEATAREERKVEAKTGHDLRKGEKRFEERSKSSDGTSAGAKQE